jgi:hypothetical protein
MGQKRNAYKILMGKPEGMRPVGRTRHKWGKDSKIEVMLTVHHYIYIQGVPQVKVTTSGECYVKIYRYNPKHMSKIDR